MSHAFLNAVASRRGHFRTESGYHTKLWMDLETLCRRPEAIRPFAQQLAHRLRPYQLDAVCGPLNEGAFVSLMVAAELGCDFTYAERFAEGAGDALFSVRYQLPRAVHSLVAGKRLAIVNDVTSAGSAVRGAFAHLDALGARVVAIASLLVLGDAIAAFAQEHRLPVESLAHAPYPMWAPESCPLCLAGEPLLSVS